jgi:hypothetical protein
MRREGKKPMHALTSERIQFAPRVNRRSATRCRRKLIALELAEPLGARTWDIGARMLERRACTNAKHSRALCLNGGSEETRARDVQRGRRAATGLRRDVR